MKTVGTRMAAAFLLVGVAFAGCRTGKPIYDSTPEDQRTPGTIAGILTLGEGGEPVAGRRVMAVSSTPGARYEAVTNITGGFSIKVPPGRYRLEVDLRPGESLLRTPGPIDINESDLDANLELVIGG